MSLPRRTLAEVIELYRLEPGLQDLYVEGVRDKSVLEWYFKEKRGLNVSVYEVGSIEVTSDVLHRFGLRTGNRGRLISLALELDENFTTTLRKVRCVADRDFDFAILGRKEARHLLYTDYTSLEMYAYEKGVFRRVLGMGFNLVESEVDAFIESLTHILRRIFAVRAANEALGWSLTILTVDRCCRIRGNVLEFDTVSFVERCLSAAGQLENRHEFDRVRLEITQQNLVESRQAMHGGDFVEIVGWYLGKKHRWGGYRRGARSALPLLLAGLDIQALGEEGLFQALERIYREEPPIRPETASPGQ